MEVKFTASKPLMVMGVIQEIMLMQTHALIFFAHLFVIGVVVFGISHKQLRRPNILLPLVLGLINVVRVCALQAPAALCHM